MTEWYLHFDPNEFAQARRVQENLLQQEDAKPAEAAPGTAGTTKKTAVKTTSEGKKGDKAGRVLPFPAQAKNRKRRQA
jgi:hypothetical protein